MRKVLSAVASLVVVLGWVGVAPAAQASGAGTTWTSQTSAADNDWQSVAYGNGVFVAVSDDGTDRVMTSPDGVNVKRVAPSVNPSRLGESSVMGCQRCRL
jgi:hypothetical protein